LLKTQVKEIFSSIAHRYDLANSALSLGFHHRWKQQLVRMVGLNRPSSVIDLCCGTGDVSFLLARDMPQAEVIGVDFCQEMLDVSCLKLKKEGLSNLKFYRADVTNLPFEDSFFSAATVSFGLRNVVNLNQALKETLRVLKPGSCFACLEFTPSASSAFPSFYRLYLQRLAPWLGGVITGQPGAYRYLASTIENYFLPKDFVLILEKAGFVEVVAEPVGSGIAYLYRGLKGE
jgi:demethylmenaquinone methyltransferase/2-methoxy-6-polyprenyl-1,4-benzoquinol methylase